MLMDHVLIGAKLGLVTIQKIVAICMSIILEIFVTECQNSYAVICSLKAYEKLHLKYSELVSSGSERLMPEK